ncbi:MAG TPA: sigma 54-interacting transcriptional regulator [Thermodesulfobacteriota bacterium]|nr:sigma 54-interacting transcriptional regulator [Thermodesulfobacteriota bacterium]
MQESIETLRTELEERLRFETLLAETSARFVNLPADRIDSEIEDAQRRICEFLDLDRSVLWQIVEREPGTAVLTHIQQPHGGPQVPELPNARDLFPWTGQKVFAGETVTITRISNLPPEAGRDRESFGLYGTKSTVVVPLSIGGGAPFGFLTFAVMREEREWPETVVKGLQLIAQVFANALVRKRTDEQLKKYVREIEELKERLGKENIYLQEEVNQLFEDEEIIGQSDALRYVLTQAKQVAPMDSTVLITGETGTGKELIARAIHRLSKRKDRVMVRVDCAALPATLIESELFGREKGAYTSALTKEIGRFEMADGSTLFLDEVGELSAEVQAKLLRILQSGEFERLGSPKTIRVDVRMIAATNRNLAEEVKKKAFREDLYYRLNVFPIEMPPLRERPDDVPLLVRAFLKDFNRKMGKRIQSVPQKAMEALQRYGWPGNIRELRNVIERAVIISRSDKLNLEMPKNMAETPSPIHSLEEAEYQHILRALKKTGWRIKGPNGAAEILKLKPSTLYTKMKKLGIPLRRNKDGIQT